MHRTASVAVALAAVSPRPVVAAPHDGTARCDSRDIGARVGATKAE